MLSLCNQCIKASRYKNVRFRRSELINGCFKFDMKMVNAVLNSNSSSSSFDLICLFSRFKCADQKGEEEKKPYEHFHHFSKQKVYFSKKRLLSYFCI